MLDVRGDGQLPYQERRIVATKAFDGIAANQSTKGNFRFLDMDLSQVKDPVMNRKDKNVKKEDLEMAERLSPTVNGSLIRLNYALIVTGVYDGWALGDTPIVRLPLRINSLGLKSWGQIEMPADWNPQEFQAVQAALPAAMS